MIEQSSPTGPEGIEPDEVSSLAEAQAHPTGVPAVDRVLADLDDGLDGAPLEEHLAAFEHAHESLRSALDFPSNDQPGDPA